MQELMSSGDPKYSFTLIDSEGNSRPLNLVEGVATAPAEEGEYTLYASYTEYGTTYYSNGVSFNVKKPEPYWFYFGDTKTLVLKSGPDVPAGYGASVTGSGKIPDSVFYDISWKEYWAEMVKAVVEDEISAPKNMGGWFADANKLTSLKGFEKLDTSNVTDMHALFLDCSALKDISGLANWDTSHVTTMVNMFAECSALENISALTEWNTSNVTNMSSIFKGCSEVTNWTALNKWDVSNVTTHVQCFYKCNEPFPIWADVSWQ